MGSTPPGPLIHRFWDGPINPLHSWTGGTLAWLHPEAQLIDWTYETLPRDIAALMGHGDVRHDSNVARYALLLHHGGLWVDNDLLAIERLITPWPWTAAMGFRREGAAMWFPAIGHPFLAECLEHSLAAKVGPSPARSGAKVLTLIGTHYPHVRLDQTVLPHDARGKRRPHVEHPKAVHLWATSMPDIRA